MGCSKYPNMFSPLTIKGVTFKNRVFASPITTSRIVDHGYPTPAGIDVFEDDRLELDNSFAERTVKPFVIGRKNWLFSDTPRGAKASCTLYSIVQTALQNGLIPFEYMKYLLEEMPGKALKDSFLDSLLPWSDTIPDYAKAPTEQ